MKKSAIAAVTLALVWIMDDTVMAQEPEVDAAVSAELEVTMVLLPQGAVRPDSITKTIELPRPAAASGANGEQGRDIAELVRTAAKADIPCPTGAGDGLSDPPHLPTQSGGTRQPRPDVAIARAGKRHIDGEDE